MTLWPQKQAATSGSPLPKAFTPARDPQDADYTVPKHERLEFDFTPTESDLYIDLRVSQIGAALESLYRVPAAQSRFCIKSISAYGPTGGQRVGLLDQDSQMQVNDVGDVMTRARAGFRYPATAQPIRSGGAEIVVAQLSIGSDIGGAAVLNSGTGIVQVEVVWWAVGAAIGRRRAVLM